MKLSLLFSLLALFMVPLEVTAQPRTQLICNLPNQAQFSDSDSDSDLVTESDFNPNSHLPSLWWAKQQYDPLNGKLIQGWVINPDYSSIDLIINRQLWTMLDYIKRYRLVNQMGTVAREYKYNLRVLNQQNQCVAFYTCDFSTSPHSCRVDFNSIETNGLELD